ncbi:cupin domain-containing protein [Hydrogenophaga borbori]|uniref:cupin domain-containing protein n=1 Tax=Hydrogenophaga borbori TaxID=2294117 RepID=UPI00301D39F5
MNAVHEPQKGESAGWMPGHQALPGVYAYDLESLPWRTTPRGTAREKAVRRDEAAGLFLGMIAFDPMSRSGVHQHRGTASSYFLSGELVDFQCTTRAGAVGINLAGATHDAVTYGGCTLFSRLEAPVTIEPDGAAIHPHAKKTTVVNESPFTPPDITVVLDEVVPVASPFARVSRRAVFDYAGTGHNRRLCMLQLWPGAHLPDLQHQGLTDWFVMAGDLRIGDTRVAGPSVVVIEPGSRVDVSSTFGCSLLAWAEAPAHAGGDPSLEPYGF